MFDDEQALQGSGMNLMDVQFTCDSDGVRVCVHVAEVFKLHADELRSIQGELGKKNEEIQVLKAIIDTLQEKPGKRPS